MLIKIIHSKKSTEYWVFELTGLMSLKTVQWHFFKYFINWVFSILTFPIVMPVNMFYFIHEKHKYMFLILIFVNM